MSNAEIHPLLNPKHQLIELDLEEVTKAELIAYATSIGVVNYAGKAKKPTQPTKLEIANAINLEQNFSAIMPIPDDLGEGIDTTGAIKEEDVGDTELSLSTSAIIRIQRDVLFMKRRVHITLNPEAVGYNEEDDSSDVKGDPIHFITWGNDVLGYVTDKVVMNTPWVCRIGAINNLKAAYAFVSVQQGNSVKTKRIKKYNIEQLEPFTKAEIEELKEQQRYIEQEAKRQSFLGSTNSNF